ncbi:MAG: alternative oxidase [Alphaproteobacteria bacterium]
MSEENTEPQNLTYHHAPENMSDRFALYLVKTMRYVADTFFAKRYGHRAVVLETVAAVPGMVGGMLLHLKSLRKMEEDHGWIKTLLDEAENERMHLMTFIEISKPTWVERAIVIITQALFFLSYALLYIISSRTAHRVVGYLEEEAVVSYTKYLECIESGEVENVKAPPIAIKYWGLDNEARLADVVKIVRADEMTHREVNHCMADKLENKECEIHASEEMRSESVEKLQEYKDRQAP